MRNIVILTILTVIVCSCGSSKKTMPKYSSDDLVYSIRKGVCFGPCPVYTLNIYGDGKAEYIGEQFSDKEGKHTKQLDEKTMTKLYEAFKSANFFNFKELYPSTIVDLPMVSISHKKGGVTHKVQGRDGRPESLLQLQSLLEKIADSTGWDSDRKTLKTRIGEDIKFDRSIQKHLILEEVPHDVSNSMLKVTFAKGASIGTWLANNSRMSPEIVKQLGSYTYIISYDTSKYSQEDVLTALRTDIKVKKVKVLQPQGVRE